MIRFLAVFALLVALLHQVAWMQETTAAALAVGYALPALLAGLYTIASRTSA